MLTEKEYEVLTRRRNGESQASIAKALKISQAAISKFETNAQKKIIAAHELVELSDKLGAVIEKGATGRKVIYKGGHR